MQKRVSFLSLFFLIASLATSCSKQPNCDDINSQNLLPEFLYDKLNTSESVYWLDVAKIKKKDQAKHLKDYAENGVKIVNIQKTKLNINSSECECSGQLVIVHPKIEKLPSNYEGAVIAKKMLSKKIKLDYSLKIIDGKETLIVKDKKYIEELTAILVHYALLQK